MKHITVYTDGACSGNPGPGGWGAVLIYEAHRMEISGGEANTTNNRMEIMAAIKALEALKQPCEVDIYSDSAYLINAHNQYWLRAWQKNGWTHKVNGKSELVLNRDLWERLSQLENIHKVTWNKVTGHAGVKENERCDELATAAAARVKSFL